MTRNELELIKLEFGRLHDKLDEHAAIMRDHVKADNDNFSRLHAAHARYDSIIRYTKWIGGVAGGICATAAGWFGLK